MFDIRLTWPGSRHGRARFARGPALRVDREARSDTRSQSWHHACGATGGVGGVLNFVGIKSAAEVSVTCPPPFMS